MVNEYGTEYAIYEKMAAETIGQQIASTDDNDTAQDIAEFYNNKPRIAGSHYYVITRETTKPQNTNNENEEA